MSSTSLQLDRSSHKGPPQVPAGTWRALAAELQPTKQLKGMDALWAMIEARIQVRLPRRGRYLKRAALIHARSLTYRDLAAARLKEQLLELGDVYRLGRDTPADLDGAFAMIAEASWRLLGMRHHVVQIAAALAMTRGCIAELATGEGKSLTATLTATVAGWRGHGCHVITVNDYLAQRDVEQFTRLYDFFGLKVAAVTSTMPPPQRRAGYAADITYTTNKEASADFLRDRLVLGRNSKLTPMLLGRISDAEAVPVSENLVMRGLASVIVDEADSVLIDEAVTPLIISGTSPNPEQTDAYKTAAELAAQLVRDEDFTLDERYREVRLTPAGEDRMDEMCRSLGGVWAGRRRRDELISQALSARYLFIKGKQYVVQKIEEKDRVVIVDEFTGRLMPDRTWRDGLHQAVEAKEGVEIQPPKITLARISFQRFFQLYDHMCGMTGTAWESRNELWPTYRVPVVRIPTHKPVIRRKFKDIVFAKAEQRWQAVVDEVRRLHEAGRPVLIGTRSVRSSEHLSKLLHEHNLEHTVLNAIRHAEEAKIVAEAGQPGRITVATNMAGRGTDIKLGRGVAEAGGLAVLATERHESGRIDRQLYGRSGRQGDPGTSAALVSVEDELVRRYASWWMKYLLKLLVSQRRGSSGWLVRILIARAQARAQNIARRQRRGVQKSDDWLDESLSFAGAGM